MSFQVEDNINYDLSNEEIEKLHRSDALKSFNSGDLILQDSSVRKITVQTEGSDGKASPAPRSYDLKNLTKCAKSQMHSFSIL